MQQINDAIVDTLPYAVLKAILFGNRASRQVKHRHRKLTFKQACRWTTKKKRKQRTATGPTRLD
jgi:hypothetical protein